MKFLKRILGIFLSAVCLLCFAACGEKDYGTLTIADIENLKIGETREISAVFSNAEYASAIEYEFKGNAIKIVDGKVTALSGGRTVPVSAKTKHHETTFTVKTSTERYDNGTLTIENIENLPVGQRIKINAVFTPSGVYEPISYTFEGNDIEISNGYVRARVPDKTVTVTAKTAHHEVKFTVSTVSPDEVKYYDIYIIAGQSNAAGYSSKGGNLGGVFENISYAGEVNAPRNGGTPAQSYLSYPFLSEVKEGLGKGASFIGPEYGMAEALNGHYSEGNRAMILKTAAGGTSLFNSTGGENNDWGNWYPRSQWGRNTVNASASPMGVLYQSLVDNFAAVYSQLVEYGYTPRVQGMAWMQGEADLGNPNGYKTLLKAFITDIRTDLKEITGDESLESMPFVIGEIATSFAYANNSQVPAFVTMQRAVASEMGNVYTVRTDDLIIVNADGTVNGTDQYHFNKNDSRTLGKRFGEALWNNARRDNS